MHFWNLMTFYNKCKNSSLRFGEMSEANKTVVKVKKTQCFQLMMSKSLWTSDTNVCVCIKCKFKLKKLPVNKVTNSESNAFAREATGTQDCVVQDYGIGSDKSAASLSQLILTTLSPLSSPGFKCPVCSKSVASNEMEVHFIMCLSKPRLSYNGKTPLKSGQLDIDFCESNIYNFFFAYSVFPLFSWDESISEEVYRAGWYSGYNNYCHDFSW